MSSQSDSARPSCEVDRSPSVSIVSFGVQRTKETHIDARDTTGPNLVVQPLLDGSLRDRVGQTPPRGFLLVLDEVTIRPRRLRKLVSEQLIELDGVLQVDQLALAPVDCKGVTVRAR